MGSVDGYPTFGVPRSERPKTAKNRTRLSRENGKGAFFRNSIEIAG